jgi:hypothetical protein
MRPLTLILSALALLLGSARPACADIIYQTGFEPPTYHLGTMEGQDGWSFSTVPVVQNSTVLSGSQAVEFDASQVSSGQNLIERGLSYCTEHDVTVGIAERRSEQETDGRKEFGLGKSVPARAHRVSLTGELPMPPTPDVSRSTLAARPWKKVRGGTKPGSCARTATRTRRRK